LSSAGGTGSSFGHMASPISPVKAEKPKRTMDPSCCTTCKTPSRSGYHDVSAWLAHSLAVGLMAPPLVRQSHMLPD
jgi:hypothetical protein